MKNNDLHTQSAVKKVLKRVTSTIVTTVVVTGILVGGVFGIGYLLNQTPETTNHLKSLDNDAFSDEDVFAHPILKQEQTFDSENFRIHYT